jgi:hypothetical protein
MIQHYLQNYITVSQLKPVLIRVLTGFIKWGNKVKNLLVYVLVLYLYFPNYQPISTHKNCFFEKPVSNFVYNVILSQRYPIGFIRYTNVKNTVALTNKKLIDKID